MSRPPTPAPFKQHLWLDLRYVQFGTLIFRKSAIACSEIPISRDFTLLLAFQPSIADHHYLNGTN